MIEKGKKRLRGYKNIKWVVAEAEKLPFENDTVDFYTIVCERTVPIEKCNY